MTPPVKRLADWDGDRLERLAEAHGTPLYVMDHDRIRANYARFSEAFDFAHVMYAAKANTGRAVVRTLYDAGADIECAAAGELYRAIEAGVAPEDLQYTAVNPPAGDLDYAVDLWEDTPELTITAGAEMTLDRLEARGFDGRLALRVNPGIGTGHHEKVATGKDAKFGLPYEEVEAVAEAARERFDLVGLHAHVGSGVLSGDLDDHERALQRVADLAERVGDLEFVDLGGGFGVPYRPDEEPLDIEAAAEMVRRVTADLDATVALEPGRYLVADAGALVTRVNTIKETPETRVVGVDAGLTSMIRPAMFDSYHHIRNVTGGDREPVESSVGGPLCTSADVFCTDRPIPRPEADDLLAIGNVGAYGINLASQFHSQPRPGEVAIEGDNERVTRRRETFEDLTRLEDEASGAE
ncbi:diaminopimelate decarboxylase [Natronomonas pharaonis DSM 2160]|uniref:Diaminopimelate decarboxylase n=1 Tax=Natronomonas pharaonis (strain ATCC 35678 / DSM 2160 / CIP 103997 / JCM 8858 / NBRC 14720 / NCIMB 2260 / Gabara) TaxID=348780 RepID=A0A1U7EV83_NATPD|nr:diaminopimelate decarboxylase [Natronomonas pharaonis]CAI48914.1 diaminopimelate decarboxylase [Natronomonas pharaonis DSM 2160]